MHIDDIKRGLRAEIKKRENEQYATFECNVRQMCKDVLAKLEEQELEIIELKAENGRLELDKRNQELRADLAENLYTEYRALHTKEVEIKEVKIGKQTWMAENLAIDDGQGGIYRNEKNGEYYYTWDAAVRVCSQLKGWHLPTKKEFATLIKNVGGEEKAGEVLRSTNGWTDSGKGTDDFGFSALPAGLRHYNGDYYYEGDYAFFWSSSESDSDSAYYMFLTYDYGSASLYGNDKSLGFSVRLVKDKEVK